MREPAWATDVRQIGDTVAVYMTLEQLRTGHPTEATAAALNLTKDVTHYRLQKMGIRRLLRKLKAVQKQEALAAYDFGVPGPEAARMAGVSNGHFYRLLQESCREARGNDIEWTAERDALLRSGLGAGETLTAIAAKLGISVTPASNRAQALGLEIPMPGRRQYPLNEAFFNVINTEEKAYWLGYIAADGCVMRERRRGIWHLKGLSFTQKGADVAHVYALRRALRTDAPVRIIKTKRGSARSVVKEGGYEKAILHVASVRLARALVALEIPPRKTLILEWPELPAHLVRHFMRGYIEADETIPMATRKNPGSLSVTSTEGFLIEMQKVLMDACSLEPTEFYQKKGSRAFTMRYGGREQLIRILHYLYDDSSISLERKRGRAMECLRVLEYEWEPEERGLAAEEDGRRRSVHALGLTDSESADLLGMAESAYRAWRWTRGLESAPPISTEEEARRRQIYHEADCDSCAARRAKAEGLSVSTSMGWRYWRTSRGLVPKQHGGFSAETVAELRILYDECQTVAEMSRRSGQTKPRVRRWMAKEGLTPKSKGGRPRKHRPVAR